MFSPTSHMDQLRMLPVQDHAYWLGDMNPRETGRLLEAIERGTVTSATSAATMRTIMRRQQTGARRIPHFLDVPVAHKTGDSPVIANDVGMVYARSGTVIIAFFTNGITGSLGKAEDMIGRVSRQIIDYFDGPVAAPTRRRHADRTHIPAPQAPHAPHARHRVATHTFGPYALPDRTNLIAPAYPPPHAFSEFVVSDCLSSARRSVDEPCAGEARLPDRLHRGGVRCPSREDLRRDRRAGDRRGARGQRGARLQRVPSVERFLALRAFVWVICVGRV